jgi:EAL domain-containing protein (putative c-di-GMP-specific phosphodiesterase class I)
MDGAEVLVRWYNEETGSYQSPAEFVPIFELNGFIVNMDHYVYEESCKLISKMRSLVTSTICISVNVSRVTAMAPDFLKFYLAIKNKYNISNGVITLEFTESFAYENYDMMKNVMISLKNNGINSSLDDFGSGYSSYNILKELPIYELKLDRFFINRTGNERRDRALLSMMIKFCNEMGIKITQEGVEQIEDLLMLREMGCDVVQGYIYSKPIMSSDFMDFIKHTTFLDVTGIRLDD